MAIQVAIMTETEIAEISRPDNGEPLASTSISHVKSLSSYSWIEAPTPTMPYLKIKKDSGLIYIAHNAARHPESPLEPLFRALYIAHPSFNVRSVDLVTDRNNVRKLMSFVNPFWGQNKREPFTIEVEVTKDTAVFCRSETVAYRIIGPKEARGYGHEFEKAYTIEIVDNGASHHRIISYRLGGMKLLVRYETDGYIRGPAQDAGEASSLPEPQSTLPSKPSYAANDKSALMIRDEGQIVTLDSILEIKTCTETRLIPLAEVIPQMWVSQTPNLVCAYHDRGLFTCSDVENITEKIKVWEKAHHANIRKLITLIKNIISVAKGHGGKAVVRYDCQRDKLVVCKNDPEKKLLPDDLYARFEKDKALSA
ncbi:hypothetical protein BJX65DRAFT_315648 [Aspergillus insuetus]